MQKAKCEIVKISVKKAKGIIDNEMFPNQRQARAYHIHNLARAMREDRFSPGSTLTFGCIDGHRYLIDGQNRLRAVMEAEIPISFSVVEIDCEALEDVRVLYARFDKHKPRSIKDIIRAKNLSEKFDITETMCIYIWSGLRNIYNQWFNVPRENITDEDIERWMDDWVAPVGDYMELLDRHYNHSFMKKPPMIACSLLVLKYSYKKGFDFIRCLMADDGLHQGTPEKTTHDFLLNLFTNVNLGTTRSAAKFQVGNKAFSCGWNSYHKGKALATISYAQKHLNRIELSGVPLAELREADHLLIK